MKGVLRHFENCAVFCKQILYFSLRDLFHCLTPLRYWYVKASLKPEVAEGFKSHQTLYVCLGVPQMLLCFHIFLYYLLYKTTDEEFPFLFYQACRNPTSDYSLKFHKLMPVQQYLLYSYFASMVYSNMYLYRFLR